PEIHRPCAHRRDPVRCAHWTQMQPTGGGTGGHKTMLMTARAVGVAGGVLMAIVGVAALIAAAADTAVIGAWFTIGAAVVACAGAVLVKTHPGSAAVLLGLAAGGAGLVAPGVIPAIG